MAAKIPVTFLEGLGRTRVLILKGSGRAMEKIQYEVKEFGDKRGYSVQGGYLGEMFIANEEDAKIIAVSLNIVNKLTLLETIAKIERTYYSLEDLLVKLKT